MKISDFYKERTDGFFNTIDDIKQSLQFQRGQIVVTIPIYPIKIGKIYALETKEGMPGDDFHLHKFGISPVRNPSELDNLKRERPIKNIQLATDEHLIVLKAKKRPAVFWKRIEVQWADGYKHDYALVIPIFDFHPPNPEFIKNVACFNYSERIYLPKCSNCNPKEGEAHFDKIQAIPMNWVTPSRGMINDNPGIIINDYAMLYFNEHWNAFWNAEIESIDDYRKELREIIESKSQIS